MTKKTTKRAAKKRTPAVTVEQLNAVIQRVTAATDEEINAVIEEIERLKTRVFALERDNAELARRIPPVMARSLLAL